MPPNVSSLARNQCEPKAMPVAVNLSWRSHRLRARPNSNASWFNYWFMARNHQQSGAQPLEWATHILWSKWPISLQYIALQWADRLSSEWPGPTQAGRSHGLYAVFVENLHL